MSRKVVTSFASLFALILSAASCSSNTDSGEQETGATLCATGETRECVGPGGCRGGQNCTNDGKWSPCDCGQQPGSDQNADIGGQDGGLTEPPDGGPGVPDSSSDPPKEGAEDCFNNVDDDGDGLVDCADPECAAKAQCAMPAPPGWIGPLALYEGKNPPEDCPEAFPLHLFSGGTEALAEPAECSECSCGVPYGGTCGAATQLMQNRGLACTGGGATLTRDGTACFVHNKQADCGGEPCASVEMRASRGAYSVFPGAPPDSIGFRCTPSEQEVTLPEPTWEVSAFACTTPPLSIGGCSYGSVCTPKPAAPFKSRLCIANMGGDVDCPQGDYPEKIVFNKTITDTRFCNDCSCGDPKGVCTLNWAIRQHDPYVQCQHPIIESGTGELCLSTSNWPARVHIELTSGAPTGGGSCTPRGGQPYGGVKAEEPVTFCCGL